VLLIPGNLAGTEAMNALAQSTNMQYAVIRLSGTKAPERVVIAYPNEETLRDLIAEPSIVGLGFVSRQDALATADGDFPKTNVLRRAIKKAIAVGNNKFQAHSVMNRLLDGFSLSKGCENARSFLNFAIASATLVFYSRNMVSTTVRALLGGSI
jgi:hypothetical protein